MRKELYRRAISDDALLGIEKYYGNSSYCGRGLGVDPSERPNLTAYCKISHHANSYENK